jgi:hypothetical protein
MRSLFHYGEAERNIHTLYGKDIKGVTNCVWNRPLMMSLG